MSRLVTTEPGDAAEFVSAVESVIAHAECERLTLVKIDGYFSRRWLGFAGKALGAVRITPRELRVPPFVPARVVSQRTFVRLADWQQEPDRAPLHIAQTSEDNLKRRMEQHSPDTPVLWWSGDSAAAGRGSLMLYRPTPAGWSGCYQEFAAPTWRLVFEKNTPSDYVDATNRASALIRRP